MFYFSITVDNTYDNIDNVVEVHNQHEEDFEPEETYIIPNCPVACREASQAEGRPGQSISLSIFLLICVGLNFKEDELRYKLRKNCLHTRPDLAS